MTTTRSSHRAAAPARGGYGFRTAARMEWHKLRTVRSTWYISVPLATHLMESGPSCSPKAISWEQSWLRKLCPSAAVMGQVEVERAGL